MNLRPQLLVSFGFFVCIHTLSATELYNLQFQPGDVGSYKVVFGNPTVQSSVGSFPDALVFHAVTSYEQISLPINVAGPDYEIQFDVLVHSLTNTQYEFGVLLDTPEVRSVDLHGGLNSITIFQPFVNANGGSFTNDQVYHFDISLDLQNNLWLVNVNDGEVFSHAFNATSLQDIRFSMNPWSGVAGDEPGTYAALDHVVVTVVPEPTCLWLTAVALILLGCKRRFPISSDIGSFRSLTRGE